MLPTHVSRKVVLVEHRADAVDGKADMRVLVHASQREKEAVGGWGGVRAPGMIGGVTSLVLQDVPSLHDIMGLQVSQAKYNPRHQTSLIHTLGALSRKVASAMPWSARGKSPEAAEHAACISPACRLHASCRPRIQQHPPLLKHGVAAAVAHARAGLQEGIIAADGVAKGHLHVPGKCARVGAEQSWEQGVCQDPAAPQGA